MCQALLGLVVTLILGYCVVGLLVERVRDSFGELPLPIVGKVDSEEDRAIAEEWKKLVAQGAIAEHKQEAEGHWFKRLIASCQPARRPKTAGWWVGWVELPIFFASLWNPSAWPLLSSWLVFKLALYWQGSNFTAFPDSMPVTADKIRYVHAKRQLGTRHIAVTLVGTGANILAAIIGVAVGRWFV